MKCSYRKVVICTVVILIKIFAARTILKGLRSRYNGESKDESKAVKERDISEDRFTNGDMVQNLQEIVSNLIEIRTTLDENKAAFIDQKYDYFQKLLMKLDRKQGLVEEVFTANTQQQTSGRYICEESLKNEQGHNFQRSNCTRLPLERLVTIVLDIPCNTHHLLETLITSIKKHHGEIGVRTVLDRDITAHNLTRSKIINSVVQGITTPFVYIARYLAEYKEGIDFQRLIEVLISQPNAVAVGGAIKNALNGYWSHGCLHLALTNYTLYYEEGYKESFNSCLKCHLIQGPFMVKTKLLKEFGFREEMKEGFYDDWFLRVNAGNLASWVRMDTHHPVIRSGLGFAVSCPDVMSVVRPPVVSDSSLVDFVRAWNIKRIETERGLVKWFGCRRGVKHRGKKCIIGGGMAVPPCCLENLADAVKFIMHACEKHGITCELQEGTLLSAVKIQKVLPWERDADIAFLTADYEKLSGLQGIFKEEGYEIKSKAVPWCCVDEMDFGGKFIVSADGWNIELNGQHRMDSNDRIINGQPTTKVQFAGQMVNVPKNPGKHARARYGKEIYKHAEHWMSTGMKSGWQEYSPGRFQDCEIHGHHGCLNEFQADGSFQFNEKGIIRKTSTKKCRVF